MKLVLINADHEEDTLDNIVRIKQTIFRIAYLYRKCTDCRINIQYTYIVGKYKIYLYEL
jgi:hypothetical protein